MSPGGFREITDRPCPVIGGRWYRQGPVGVIYSIDIDLDGVQWVHVSASCVDRVPTWQEMCEVKAWFIGNDRDAIQYMPKLIEYVNDHPFCLHLWSRIDGKRLMPDIRKYEPALRRKGI